MNDVRHEIRQRCQQRAHLNYRDKGGPIFRPIGCIKLDDAHHSAGQRQVRGAADRNELGKPLNDSKYYCLRYQHWLWIAELPECGESGAANQRSSGSCRHLLQVIGPPPYLVERARLQHLSDIDDLAGVHAQVGHYSADLIEEVLVIVGFFRAIQEPGCIKRLDGSGRLFDHLFEYREQLPPGHGPLSGEFRCAVACVVKTADAAAQVVPDRSRKVKYEVADRIARRVRPPPDLFVCQLLNGLPDLPWQKLRYTLAH